MSFVIPEHELRFRASRAGGPGGQHVNKTSTRVEVVWNVVRSPSLTDARRARLTGVLASRIDRYGRVRVSCGTHRSQKQNRDEAVARLQALVADALREAAPRKKTTIPRAAREARLEQKRRRAQAKARRKPVTPDE